MILITLSSASSSDFSTLVIDPEMDLIANYRFFALFVLGSETSSLSRLHVQHSTISDSDHNSDFL